MGNWLAVDSNSPLLQTVVVHAGHKDDDEHESLGVEVRFPRPFPRNAKPAVFATAYGEDYPDTFSVCVQHSSRKRARILWFTIPRRWNPWKKTCHLHFRSSPVWIKRPRCIYLQSSKCYQRKLPIERAKRKSILSW